MEENDKAEVPISSTENETKNNIINDDENNIENVLKKDEQIEEKFPSSTISEADMNKDSIEVESSQKEKYDNVVAEIKNQNSLKNHKREDKIAIKMESDSNILNPNNNYHVNGRCSVDSIEISEENDEIKDLMTRPKFSMQSQLSNMSTASSISGNGSHAEIQKSNRKIERVDTDDTTSIDTNITLNEEIIIDPRKIQGAAPTQISERFIA